MRRDNRWEPSDQTSGYIGSVGINTFPPPSVPHIHLICPLVPLAHRLPPVSPLSSPRRRLSCLTAGPPTPWSFTSTSSKITPAPRRCSAAHHRIRVCVALIQSSTPCIL